MSEQLYNFTDPPISANDGWQQMHALLNQHLPVERQTTDRKGYLPFAYAVMLLAIFLFITLQLDKNVLFTSAGSKAAHSIAGSGTIGRPLLKLYINKKTYNKPAGNLASFKNDGALLSFNNKQLLPISPNDAINLMAITGKATTGMMVDTIENLSLQIARLTANTISANATLPYPGEGLRTVTVKRSWSLWGGAGINTSADNIQTLQPYPIAEARYNLTPHFYISAGLSAWSPVATGTGGISKTIYLYDTANNISLYNETTTYNHLHYADIPFSVGINLTKNISVLSGIQMSVLLNKKTKKTIAPYDFQISSITVPVSAALPPPNMEQDYDVKMRPVDYRFIAGIRYTLKKTVVGLTYQQGLRSSARGIHAAKNTNQALALNVFFRLK